MKFLMIIIMTSIGTPTVHSVTSMHTTEFDSPERCEHYLPAVEEAFRNHGETYNYKGFRTNERPHITVECINK